MSDLGVHPHEMRGHPNIDDDAAEALLDGRIPRDRPDLGTVAAVLSDVRAGFAQGPAPIPGVRLAEVLAVGLANDKGDPAATPASNVDGPANPQVAGLPNWRRRGMIGTVLGTTAGKVAIACAAAVTAVGGVAYADGLPKPAQDVVSHAAGTVGIDLPSHGDDSPGHDKPDSTTQDQPGAGNEQKPPVVNPPAAGVTDPTATPEPGDQSGTPAATPGDDSGEHSDTPSTEPAGNTGEHDATGGAPTTEPDDSTDGEHHDTTSTTAPHDDGEHHDSTSTAAPHDGGDG